MTTQTKSVVELAREAGINAGCCEDDITAATFGELRVLCEAYAAQAIDQYKQELLQGVELPEPTLLHVATTFRGHLLDVKGYTKDQLQQASATAVLRERGENVRLQKQNNIVARECLDAEDELESMRDERDTLKSHVTQCEQELALALAYKQDAERFRFRHSNYEDAGGYKYGYVKVKFEVDGDVQSMLWVTDAELDTAIDAARAGSEDTRRKQRRS